jgi:hypothetical protein
MYSSTLSLTSALGGVGGRRHAWAALPPAKTRNTLYKSLGGSQARSGWVRNTSPLPRFHPRIFQLVANRYTDWVIPAQFYFVEDSYEGVFYTVWCNGFVPTFRTTVVPPTSGWLNLVQVTWRQHSFPKLWNIFSVNSQTIIWAPLAVNPEYFVEYSISNIKTHLHLMRTLREAFTARSFYHCVKYNRNKKVNSVCTECVYVRYGLMPGTLTLDNYTLCIADCVM